MFPRISVVTSSYNQGRFIGRTIDSVLAQAYPNLEHLVIDGMSSDETPAVLAPLPRICAVLREPDHGQADAVNKGFRLASGDILCFLNSDDVFLPGALHRVAREIDPSRGRCVVMGRCLFIDEHDKATGLEHAVASINHERVLKVWNGNFIPQPATFWTREVWEKCGPLDETEHLVLDYDLMCRISRCYHFHRVDDLLAGYRLHASSKTCSNVGDEVMDLAIRCSRRCLGARRGSRAYSHCWDRWPSTGSSNSPDENAVPSMPSCWPPNRGGKAARCAPRRIWGGRRCSRRRASCAASFSAAWRRSCAARRPDRWPLALTWQSPRVSELTSVFRSFTEPHPDGCVGPHFAAVIQLEKGSHWALIDSAPFSESCRGPWT